MLPLAVATSIDALAVGVSFAFLRVSIVPAVSFIGLITFALSVGGVKIGSVFGLKYKAKAEFAGGAILVLIGCNILLKHLGIIPEFFG
jgi:putative Mn2+ efflux pump MntP